MHKLSEEDINLKLETLNGWELVNGALEANLEFPNFKEAFTAITRIALEAEAMQHHPEWYNSYNQLQIRLYTHEVDGLTEKDFQLAKIILDSIV